MLGALQAWVFRDFMNPDGISYLDISDAWLRADWRSGTNGLWSPLYPMLLVVARLSFKPAALSEFVMVHFVNLCIYLAALASFHFLLVRLLRCVWAGETVREQPARGLPEWALIGMSYGLFIWSSLDLIHVAKATPDMCVAALIYFACAVLLSARVDPRRWSLWCAAGVTLGICYWAKAATLPIAVIFIAASLFGFGSVRRALPGAAVMAASFLAIVAPLVVMYSGKAGHISLGEAARLNYAWHVNRVPNTHWRGQPPGSGVPVQTTRTIWRNPPVYEFREPIVGTYPPAYDPSYWYEGLRVRFSWKQQADAVARSAKTVGETLLGWRGGLVVVSLLTAMGILLLLGRQSGFSWHVEWSVMAPSAAAMGLYSLVHVESRYIGPFVALPLIGIVSAVRIENKETARRLGTVASVVVLVCMAAHIALSTAATCYLAFSDPSAGGRLTGSAHRLVATELWKAGVAPGDKIAHIGDSRAAAWARLARVRIIAEILPDDASAFWALSEAERSLILKNVERLGVKAVAAEMVPAWAPLGAWRRIAGTPYYVYVFGKEQQH